MTYYLYDPKTRDYIGVSEEEPTSGTNYTTTAPDYPDVFSLDKDKPWDNGAWFREIYTPDTDTWRGWDKAEYQKWVVDAKVPDSAETFNIALLNEIATLKLEQIELREELEKNVPND